MRRVDVTALLAWFDGAKRPLAWRREPRDPYAVWVSEIMLQQTRVETVERYFEAFLKRFPDIASLARASEDDLMKAWEGLGYYRRARLLHQGARAVVERQGGQLPSRYHDLLELPGFGPYTAGAVASLAFHEPVPAVDGNVIRVATRLLAHPGDAATSATRRIIDAWVREHQPRESPGAFNEALMELGATVCSPRAPRCGACPVAGDCRARVSGAPERFPAKTAATPPRPARVALAVALRGGKWLLEKRESGLLAGTWGLPWVEIRPDEDPADALGSHVARLTGGRAHVAPECLVEGVHVFSHIRWSMEAYAVDADGQAGTWRRPEEVALGTAHRKVVAQINALPF